jgi:hypothetical protein
MFKRGCILQLVTLAAACNGGNSTVTSPSPRTFPPPPHPIVVTGQVTDSATSAPISGAIVSFNLGGSTTADGSGNFSVTGSLDPTYNVTFVSANNYEEDIRRYIGAKPQNFHLHRIERITAGDSTSVTVAPDDTLCVNNSQDDATSSNYVCRSVRVVAPSDGVMTLEAVSTQDGAHPPLELEIVGGDACCSLQNPRSIQVTARTEVIANVEMVLGWTTSQSFTLKTSMAQTPPPVPPRLPRPIRQ